MYVSQSLEWARVERLTFASIEVNERVNGIANLMNLVFARHIVSEDKRELNDHVYPNTNLTHVRLSVNLQNVV